MDPDYISPPPAYSEQEFDRKISQATTLSLHTSQTSSTSIDSDGWPQYDPAAFEGTEGSSTSPTTAERSSPFPIETSSGKKDVQHGGIGDLSSVVPLRIEKKNQPKSLPKPPTSSHSRNESSSTIGENSIPTVFHSETSNHDDFRSQPYSVRSTHVEDNVPLMPPITTSPVQQSLQIAHKVDDGLSSMPLPPPFEAQPPTRLPEARHLDNHHHQQYVDPYSVTRSQSPRQSLPIQSRPQILPQERPMSSYSSSPSIFQSSHVSCLDFNPSVAYGRTQPVAPPLKQPVKGLHYDPNSFYNSAVSAQITPITAGQHGHSSYSSYNSRNSFSPQGQYQQQGSPTTYSRPGHYSQSYVSQDPLPSERSSALFEINNSRQPVLHSPARSSSYSMSSNYQTFNTSPSPAYQYVGHTANVPGNIYYEQQSPENRWTTQ